MELYPVSVDILYDGMMVDFGIYYCRNNRQVLLCKDLVLTNTMIESLKEVLQQNKNVYMDKKNHNRLIKETEYFKNVQTKLEHRVGYDNLKDFTQKLFSYVAENGTVCQGDIQEIVTLIDRKLKDSNNTLIMQCINGVRQVDKYLYVHSVNVGLLNGLMGKWCGYDEKVVSKLIKIGLMHDLGKLKISPSILNKPSTLTLLEYEAVKRHPQFGHYILKLSGEKDNDILDGVLHHHEKINGTGYPGKNKDGEISTFAKITAISDVYDAMAAKRPYKEGVPPFAILDQLSQNVHSDLDKEYTRIFLKNMIRNLIGCSVMLSNGAVARVEFIDKNRLSYPIVSIDDHIVNTNENLYCVRMYNE